MKLQFKCSVPHKTKRQLLWFVAILRAENLKNVQIIGILKGHKNVTGSRKPNLGKLFPVFVSHDDLGFEREIRTHNQFPRSVPLKTC